jgi:chloramphenicol-sensitive protein RarD
LPDTHRRGVAYALCAYALWGLFPLYFKAVASLPPLDILAHRVVWSLGFVAVLVSWRIGWRWLPPVLSDRRVLKVFALSTLMVFLNWAIYIWAVARGRVIDASLGYFMNPLVNVLLGWLVLHERLRPVQWVSVLMAAGGVVWLTWIAGAPPWIGLSLAAAFGLYGLLRKTASLGAWEGFSLETLFMLPFALLYLGWFAARGEATYPELPLTMQLLIIASGPVTALPLLFFAAAARRIPLSTLGLIQYLGPSVQLLLAIFLFGEPFGGAKALGFAAIWAALVLYTGDMLWRGWRAGRAPTKV